MAVSNLIFRAERIASGSVYGLFEDQHRGQCSVVKWVEEEMLLVSPCEVLGFYFNPGWGTTEDFDQRSEMNKMRIW